MKIKILAAVFAASLILAGCDSFTGSSFFEETRIDASDYDLYNDDFMVSVDSSSYSPYGTYTKYNSGTKTDSNTVLKISFTQMVDLASAKSNISVYSVTQDAATGALTAVATTAYELNVVEPDRTQAVLYFKDGLTADAYVVKVNAAMKAVNGRGLDMDDDTMQSEPHDDTAFLPFVDRSNSYAIASAMPDFKPRIDVSIAQDSEGKYNRAQVEFPNVADSFTQGGTSSLSSHIKAQKYNVSTGNWEDVPLSFAEDAAASNEYTKFFTANIAAGDLQHVRLKLDKVQELVFSWSASKNQLYNALGITQMKYALRYDIEQDFKYPNNSTGTVAVYQDGAYIASTRAYIPYGIFSTSINNGKIILRDNVGAGNYVSYSGSSLSDYFFNTSATHKEEPFKTYQTDATKPSYVENTLTEGNIRVYTTQGRQLPIKNISYALTGNSATAKDIVIELEDTNYGDRFVVLFKNVSISTTATIQEGSDPAKKESKTYKFGHTLPTEAIYILSGYGGDDVIKGICADGWQIVAYR